MHDMAKWLLTTDTQAQDLPGLGLTIPSAHALLLESYKAKTLNGLWHTLADDGYIHAHLTWHFQQANQLSELHQLFREETEAGRNGWYEACERLGQTANFVTDVARAWQLAEVSWTDSDATLSQVIGLQCRYALITTSLNSLAANLPEYLLIGLVTKGVWMPEQGLVYARQIPDQQRQIYSLINIAEHLPPFLRAQALQSALAAIHSIANKEYRANALRILAGKMPEVLSEALAAISSIANEEYRANALRILAGKMPEVLPEALAAACSITNERYRAKALSALASELS